MRGIDREEEERKGKESNDYHELWEVRASG